MGDRMTPIPFGKLMDWALREQAATGHVFGLRQPYQRQSEKNLSLFNRPLEIPFGPAAGPHTQLAQNIIAAYAAGSRFFELKTVQTLDGEDLHVAKPCILAEDECYNCEWSTELTVGEAMGEYIKAAVALQLLAKEWQLGAADGFQFNMSVGYTLDGIRSAKIDGFIEGMRNAAGTAAWQECQDWLQQNLSRFSRISAADIAALDPQICNSVTLSTLHGCPADEIERIAAYLLEEKGLHTFIKCNPTLLGYPQARQILNEMGYDYLAFTDFHFRDDLQFEAAVPMLKRLQEKAARCGLHFGVKLTNTFPVDVKQDELPSDEMYLSGKPLAALSLAVAQKLSQAFDGRLRISYSGGADFYNIRQLFRLGIWPITVATTLLKPGGYQRCSQIAAALEAESYDVRQTVDIAGMDKLLATIRQLPHYRKPLKPLPSRKLAQKVPLFDCFLAPCREACPIHQDIPAYLQLLGEGKPADALNVILEKNPLPFITGTICPHHCADKCTRNFYEEAIRIRESKLKAAKQGADTVLPQLKAKPASGKRVAVIGGGPAGIAAAYLLAKGGASVVVFEKTAALGGVVRHIIPPFRIRNQAIDRDIAFAKALGVEFRCSKEITELEQLFRAGFDDIVIAIGASRSTQLGIPTERELNAIDFLRRFKLLPAMQSLAELPEQADGPDAIAILDGQTAAGLDLGEHIVVIGGGNTAMDAARAAKMLPHVKDVTIVYRRTVKQMPAEEEELRLAEEEGVRFRELLAPRQQAKGRLICEKMRLGELDASGRRSSVGTGELEELAADSVIAALGERVDGGIYTAFGLKTDHWGAPLYNAKTMESSLPHVYVIGDGAHGPATVVEAIADATAAAQAILKAAPAAAIEAATDVQTAAARHGILAEYRGGNEATRCLACSTVCEACTEVCPNRANLAIRVPGEHMPVILHVDAMCNECGNCAAFCPYDSAPYLDKLTLFANAADFDHSKNNGFFRIDATSGRYRLRLEGETRDLQPAEENSRIAMLLRQLEKEYAYLF